MTDLVHSFPKMRISMETALTRNKTGSKNIYSSIKTNNNSNNIKVIKYKV
jgi:hypothetical protein